MDRDPKPALASALLPSPLGPIAAAASHRGVRLLHFAEGAADASHTSPSPIHTPDPGSPAAAHLEQLRDELAQFFDGSLRTFTVALDLAGTPFQLRVWDRLLKIPFGETISYRTLARDVGSPAGFRAVGAANGRNPVAIVVPCHRVIAHDGTIGGYGGGLERKRFLLDLELHVAHLPLGPSALA